ncbi:hypothetical protein [Prosthecobacter sp.]|uniref:hypothetical protein n=1 Tax=Prosthecobacter sp. TaxID=1965333 RepID=UPI001E0F3C13|nr:hypothetical protein [Prosthecobacter sp.]MCB1278228.1 hypothetical protein [Prosthecobacter sp.]
MKHLLLALLVSTLTCSITWGQSESAIPLLSPVPVPDSHLTGTLERKFAIGGDTTGWSLSYGDKKHVELLLPKDALAWAKDGLVVAVTGTFGTQHYVERGDVPFFIVKTITRMDK